MEEFKWSQIHVRVRTPVGLLFVLGVVIVKVLALFEDGQMILEYAPKFLKFLGHPLSTTLLILGGISLIMWEVYDQRKVQGEPAKLRLKHYAKDSLIGFAGLVIVVIVVGLIYGAWIWVAQRETKSSQAKQSTSEPSAQPLTIPPPLTVKESAPKSPVPRKIPKRK